MKMLNACLNYLMKVEVFKIYSANTPPHKSTLKTVLIISTFKKVNTKSSTENFLYTVITYILVVLFTTCLLFKEVVKKFLISIVV